MSNSNSNEASSSTEANKGVRGFRSTADVENFYRFIYENNLRREAKKIFEIIFRKGSKKKSKKSLQ